MNLAEFTIRNKVLSVIVILLVIVGGWTAYQDMPRFEDPEFTIRTAQVIAQYPGASPKEVAEEVTEPLERAIQQLQEVDSIESKSSAGVAEISVNIKYEFSRSKSDLQQVWTKLRNKVNDAAQRLPPGVGTPLVYDDFGDVYGLYYFITAEGYTPSELRRYAKSLQSDILQVEGVAVRDDPRVNPRDRGGVDVNVRARGTADLERRAGGRQMEFLDAACDHDQEL